MKSAFIKVNSVDLESLWIEQESINHVRNSVTGTAFSAFIALVVLNALLYLHVDTTLWWTWTALHTLVFIFRIIYFYGIRNEVNIRENFYERFAIIISFIGCIWGSHIYLILNGEQTKVQAIALCVILTYGIMTTINLSRHMYLLKVFLTAYGAGLIGALLVNLFIDLNNKDLVEYILLICITGLFIFILFKFGKQINHTNIGVLSLQYRNQRLIESLTIEKQAALNAVDVKNRFLAGATHDMRQPVLALDLYTDMLMSTPKELPNILPKIALATKSVISLFDALFDLARMSMNQIKPEKVHFNINDMIVDLNVQFQPLAATKGLKLRVRQSQQRIEIFDDPVLIRRIMSNLLSNSVKYADNGGILLACRHDKLRGIRLEVWDTGVGISPKMQKAVFDEFYKNPENEGTSDGFGLGLSLVSQMCTLLGHKVLMKSQRGRGTVVSIQLSESKQWQ